MTITDTLQIELNYYSRNREKIGACKDILIELHGIEGFNWLRDSIRISEPKQEVEESVSLTPTAIYKLERKRKTLDRKKFKREVHKLTELQPLHLLENFDKRGFKEYHVDHIVSIFKAFKLGWTPEQCADISNLQMLPYKENLLKGIK